MPTTLPIPVATTPEEAHVYEQFGREYVKAFGADYEAEKAAKAAREAARLKAVRDAAALAAVRQKAAREAKLAALPLIREAEAKLAAATAARAETQSKIDALKERGIAPAVTAADLAGHDYAGRWAAYDAAKISLLSGWNDEPRELDDELERREAAVNTATANLVSAHVHPLAVKRRGGDLFEASRRGKTLAPSICDAAEILAAQDRGRTNIPRTAPR